MLEPKFFRSVLERTNCGLSCSRVVLHSTAVSSRQQLKSECVPRAGCQAVLCVSGIVVGGGVWMRLIAPHFQ